MEIDIPDEPKDLSEYPYCPKCNDHHWDVNVYKRDNRLKKTIDCCNCGMTMMVILPQFRIRI